MEHHIDWQLNREGVFAAIEYPARKPVRLSCGGIEKKIDSVQGAIMILRLGCWIVQRNGGMLSITCLRASSETLKIAFDSEVTAKMSLAGANQWTREFPQTVALTLCEARLTVTDGQTQRRNPNPERNDVHDNRRKEPANISNQQIQALTDERDQLSQQLIATKQQLSAATQRANAAENRAAAVERTAQATESNLMAAQAKVAELTLQLATATQLEAVRGEAAGLSDQLQTLNESNSRLQAEVAQLRAAYEDAQLQQTGMQAERDMLTEQIAQLQQAKLDTIAAIEEVSTLDVDACKQLLAEQRQMLLSDEAALTLLQQCGSIRSASATQNLAESTRLLEQAEKQIAAIVALREHIEQSVWRTVETGVNGGAVPAATEAGEA